MKIMSIIGTRPQYIKVKPLYDYFKNKCNHIIVDTLQHYSDSVSKNIISDLDLKIDYFLGSDNKNEIEFISEITRKIQKVIRKEQPDIILVFGDTNSTFCAALVAYKMNKKVCHVEAGLRCGDKNIPEEINRIFTDSVSDINFCSSISALSNIDNVVYCGDLEYELLNNISPTITYSDYGVMTIHRQSNCNLENLNNIMDYCREIDKKIIFPIHHRMASLIKQINLPNNIDIIEPLPYNRMVELMAGCNFIFTDSGSIQKTSAFFGKRTLVFRNKTEWVETEKENFCKKIENMHEDISWVLESDKIRHERLYLHPEFMPSEIIYNEITK